MPNIGQPHPTRRQQLNPFGYRTEEDVSTEDHLGRLRKAMARPFD